MDGGEGEEKKEEEKEEEMAWGKDIGILEFCHKPRNAQRHKMGVERLREASCPQAAGAQSYAARGGPHLYGKAQFSTDSSTQS